MESSPTSRPGLESRRRRGRNGVCQLVALLGCFQCLVVITLVTVTIFVRDPASAPGAEDGGPLAIRLRSRKESAGSPTDRLEVWMKELLDERSVDISVNSTLPAHLGFRMRGTIIPRPLYPNRFDGEFKFADSRGSRYAVVVVQNKGYQWITGGVFGARLEYSGCVHPAQMPPLDKLADSFSSARWFDNGMVAFAFAGDVYRVKCTNIGFGVRASSGARVLLSRSSAPIPDFVSMVHELPPCSPLYSKREATKEDFVLSADTMIDPSSTLDLAEEECPCTSEEKKKCLFLHGIGVHENIGVITSYPDYWGTIEQDLPCCSDVKFTHLNTVD